MSSVSPAPADRSPPRALWPLWTAMLAALLGFQLVFGVRLVGAGDAYWSNPHGDMGQMLAGELAGLRAPWRVPILTPDTLLAPDRVSLVYTDSIPWLTALLKLLHLGRVFSLLGTFLLLAWLAQPAAMYALLRAAGVRRWETLLAGSLLALLVPAWLGRQIGHIALSGHAIQITALALAVHAVRAGLSRPTAAAFVGLGVLATGVHAYHVPVVAMMLVAAAASEALQRRPDALWRGALTLGAFLAAVLGAAWFVGYFVGRGASGGVDALGIYEMNLIAPVFPQASALAGQKWTGGWFTHSFDPTGGQVYEGFNYQGAGVLLLIAAAAVSLWRAPPQAARDEPRTERSRSGVWARRWAPLAATLAVMFIYALGTKPYVGSLSLFEVPLPRATWMEPFALFRAHGRFFWTPAYALFAGALTVLDGAAGARPRRFLLAAAVLLQAADMSQMLWGLHDRFSQPEALTVPAELATPAFKGRDLHIFPGFFCTTSSVDQTEMRQLALIAQRQHASTNVAETARPPLKACPSPAADLQADAATGDRRITVVMGGSASSPPVANAFTGRSDCFRYHDRQWFCGRGLEEVRSLTHVEGRDLQTATIRDATLEIAKADLRAALVSGWAKPEPTGVWSDGPTAVLRLPHPDLPAHGVLTVDLDALSYQPPGRKPQRVVASLPDGSLSVLSVPGGEYQTAELRIPAERLAPGPVTLRFDFPDALSPDSVLPGSGDPRRLGMGLRKITLAH